MQEALVLKRKRLNIVRAEWITPRPEKKPFQRHVTALQRPRGGKGRNREMLPQDSRPPCWHLVAQSGRLFAPAKHPTSKGGKQRAAWQQQALVGRT